MSAASGRAGHLYHGQKRGEGPRAGAASGRGRLHNQAVRGGGACCPDGDGFAPHRRGGRELCAYDVVLDTVNHTARRNGEPVELRRLEYDLLELLMRNRGAALYRDVMYERVWGGIPDTESLRTVDTHIARLRKKLGWTDKIETVYKIGYRLKKED